MTRKRLTDRDSMKERLERRESEIAQSHLEYLVSSFAHIHGKVFGSEFMKTTRDDECVLVTDETLCVVVLVNPGTNSSVPAQFRRRSMLFGLTDPSNPLVDGKRHRGTYFINLDGVEDYLRRKQSEFADVLASLGVASPKGDAERLDKIYLICLAAHEIRHEQQFFCKPMLRSIREIETTNPQTVAVWNTTGRQKVLSEGGGSVESEEDAIVTEAMIWRLLFKSPLPLEAHFDEIVSLLKS